MRHTGCADPVRDQALTASVCQGGGRGHVGTAAAGSADGPQHGLDTPGGDGPYQQPVTSGRQSQVGRSCAWRATTCSAEATHTSACHAMSHRYAAHIDECASLVPSSPGWLADQLRWRIHPVCRSCGTMVPCQSLRQNVKHWPRCAFVVSAAGCTISRGGAGQLVGLLSSHGCCRYFFSDAGTSIWPAVAAARGAPPRY